MEVLTAASIIARAFSGSLFADPVSSEKRTCEQRGMMACRVCMGFEGAFALEGGERCAQLCKRMLQCSLDSGDFTSYVGVF